MTILVPVRAVGSFRPWRALSWQTGKRQALEKEIPFGTRPIVIRHREVGDGDDLDVLPRCRERGTGLIGLS